MIPMIGMLPDDPGIVNQVDLYVGLMDTVGPMAGSKWMPTSFIAYISPSVFIKLINKACRKKPCHKHSWCVDGLTTYLRGHSDNATSLGHSSLHSSLYDFHTSTFLST